MNVKKELKKIEKQQDDRILEQGQELHDELVRQYGIKQQRKVTFTRRNRLIGAVACCVAVVLIAVSLFVIFYPSQDTKYFAKDELIEAISLESFYEKVSDFPQINTEMFRVISIDRKYDGPTQDTLFYVIHFVSQDELCDGEIFVVTNSNYQFNYNYALLPLKDDFNGHEIDYYEQKEVCEDSTSYEYYGTVDTDNFQFVFSVIGLTTGELPSPSELLQSLFVSAW